MRRISLAVRLALATSAVLLVVLAVVGVVVQYQIGERMRETTDQQLVDTASALAATTGDLADALDDDDDGDLDVSDRDAQLVDRDGNVVDGTEDLRDEPPLLDADDLALAREDNAVIRTVTDDDDDELRVIALPRGDDVLIVATELEAVEDAQEAFTRVYLPIAIAATVLGSAAVFAVLRAGLRPIDRITRTAQAIGAHDLSGRVPEPRRQDEVGRLARTLNDMLARLEAAIAREREFAADASHELRTPLTILRGRLELLQNATTDTLTHENLQTALDEADRIGALVDDLMVLARADANALDARRPIDLGDLAERVAARFQPVADAAGVTLTCSGAAVVAADERAVERALSNLLDNAIRYTPASGSVQVCVEPIEAGARVRVADTGPGVPPGQLDRLFERFTRLDASRSGSGGAGIGLAIVAAVANAHGGRVYARNRESGGLEVVLELRG